MILSDAKTALAAYGFDTANDPMASWLDQAKNEVETVFDWPFLQKVATINTLANVATVGLPSDFFKVQSLRDVTRGKKLSFKEPDGFERDITDPTKTGNPDLFTVVSENQLTVFPVPNADTSWRLIYQTSLTDITTLTSSDPLPGPARFHYTYVLGAAYLGLQADNEEDRSANAQALFNQNISRLVRKYSSILGSSRVVRNVQGY